MEITCSVKQMEENGTYFRLVAPFQIQRKKIESKKDFAFFSQPKAKKSESEQTYSHQS